MDQRSRLLKVFYYMAVNYMPLKYEQEMLEGALGAHADEPFLLAMEDEIELAFDSLLEAGGRNEYWEKLAERFTNACIKHILYRKHHCSHPGFAALSPALWSAKYDAYAKLRAESREQAAKEGKQAPPTH